MPQVCRPGPVARWTWIALAAVAGLMGAAGTVPAAPASQPSASQAAASQATAPAAPRLALDLFRTSVSSTRPAAETPRPKRASPPQRIVSLVPHATEILFAIGAGDKVAGVSDSCQWPADASTRPRLGGAFDPKIPEIVALKPDIVILSPSHVLHRRAIEGAGIETLTVDSRSINDALRTIYDLSMLTGASKKARELVDPMVGEINALMAEGKKRTPRRTLICVDHEPASLDAVVALMHSNYLDDVLAAAGAANAAAPPGRTLSMVRKMKALDVVAAKPDVVLDLQLGKAPSAVESQRIERLWRDLFEKAGAPAPRALAIHDPYLMVPGMRMAETIRKMAKWIYPEEADGVMSDE